MTVDFAELLRRHEAGEDLAPRRPPAVVGKWPKRGVTFDVERGSFNVSAEMLQRAEVSGDDYEIRRTFARHLAEHEDARPYRYERHRGGLRVYWRSIRVVACERSPRQR